MPLSACRTGVSLNYEISGDGEPLLLRHGHVGVDPAVGRLVPRLAQRYRVIAFDNRGLGGSERGEGADLRRVHGRGRVGAARSRSTIPRAHIMGWSLGLRRRPGAGARPPRAGRRPRSCTRPGAGATASSARSSTALRAPYVHRDMEAALAAAGLAFSPQLLDHPDLAAMMEAMLPAFPQTEEQMQVDRRAVGRRPGARHARPARRHHRADPGDRRRAGPAHPALAGEGRGRRHPGRTLRAA